MHLQSLRAGQLLHCGSLSTDARHRVCSHRQARKFARMAFFADVVRACTEMPASLHGRPALHMRARATYKACRISSGVASPLRHSVIGGSWRPGSMAKYHFRSKTARARAAQATSAALVRVAWKWGGARTLAVRRHLPLTFVGARRRAHSLWPSESGAHLLVGCWANIASSSCASSTSTVCLASSNVSWRSCGHGLGLPSKQCCCCVVAARVPLPSASVSDGGPRRRWPDRRQRLSLIPARTAGGASRRHLASRVAGSGSKPS